MKSIVFGLLAPLPLREENALWFVSIEEWTNKHMVEGASAGHSQNTYTQISQCPSYHCAQTGARFQEHPVMYHLDGGDGKSSYRAITTPWDEISKTVS